MLIWENDLWFFFKFGDHEYRYDHRRHLIYETYLVLNEKITRTHLPKHLDDDTALGRDFRELLNLLEVILVSSPDSGRLHRRSLYEQSLIDWYADDPEFFA